jgi:hypothetical protein
VVKQAAAGRLVCIVKAMIPGEKQFVRREIEMEASLGRLLSLFIGDTKNQTTAPETTTLLQQREN